jgi:hypothetical protein
MDRTTELHYLISGNNQFGRVNLSRAAAGAAIKKANELLQEGYLDVRISTPRGRMSSISLKDSGVPTRGSGGKP